MAPVMQVLARRYSTCGRAGRVPPLGQERSPGPPISMRGTPQTWVAARRLRQGTPSELSGPEPQLRRRARFPCVTLADMTSSNRPGLHGLRPTDRHGALKVRVGIQWALGAAPAGSVSRRPVTITRSRCE